MTERNFNSFGLELSNIEWQKGEASEHVRFISSKWISVPFGRIEMKFGIICVKV